MITIKEEDKRKSIRDTMCTIIPSRNETSYNGKLLKKKLNIKSNKLLCNYKIKLENTYYGYLRDPDMYMELIAIDRNNKKEDFSLLLSIEDIEKIQKELEELKEQLKEIKDKDLKAKKELEVFSKDDEIDYIQIDCVDDNPIDIGTENTIRTFKFTPIMKKDCSNKFKYSYSIYVNISLSGLYDLDKQWLYPLIGDIPVKYDNKTFERGKKFAKQQKEDALKALDEKMKLLRNSKK